MALIVQKYGGTSVKTVERVKHVAKHIESFRNAGHDLIITVSAPGGVTDKLTELTKQFDKRPPTREMDVLLSTGEQISIALLAMALNDLGIPSVSMTGSQMGIMTTDAHTKARINYIKTDKIRKELDAGKVIIVAGFQGITEDGEITTLGRGGSDTTAVAIAAAIKADLCEIYTDVDGVYTADPRMVERTQKLEKITHDEMLELASLGAKVLHPRSVEIAKIHNVKLCVRSSFDTTKEGTFVVANELLEKEFVVTGLACDQKVAKIGIFDLEDKPGSATKVFQALADANINVDMIVQSAMRNGLNDIAFTVLTAFLIFETTNLPAFNASSTLSISSLLFIFCFLPLILIKVVLNLSSTESLYKFAFNVQYSSGLKLMISLSLSTTNLSATL